MDRYDPESAPDPKQWLALDEGERNLLVEHYHRDARIPMPRRARPLHAVMHTVVENQLALDDQTVVRETLERLMRDGLRRHEALHAIGSVLITYLNDLVRVSKPSTDGHAAYYAALQKLTVEAWRGR